MSSSWFTDDITFCMSECDIKSCYRHPDNIKEKFRPYSYSYLKGIEPYCKYYDNNKIRKVTIEDNEL